MAGRKHDQVRSGGRGLRNNQLGGVVELLKVSVPPLGMPVVVIRICWGRWCAGAENSSEKYYPCHSMPKSAYVVTLWL